MRRRNLLLATSALTGTLALNSHVARADVISFTDSFSSIASASGTIDGTFDISGFLASEAAAGNNVVINSATIQVYGYSAANNLTATSYVGNYVAGYYAEYFPYYYSYSCGFWGEDTCYAIGGYYAQYYPIYGSEYSVVAGDNQVDMVIADFGDQQISANDQQAATNGYSSTQYTETFTTTGNDFGSVSTSTGLDQATLDDLVVNSNLPFTLNVTEGDFDNLNIQMDVNYNLSQVPLPPTAILFGTGLLGMIFARRRKAPKA